MLFTKLVPLCFGLFCLATLASADDGVTLDLIVPPSANDRFHHAEFSCWLPDGHQPIRAVIIHQHGCPSASPAKHPPITSDWQWRALARKHNCALLVPMYEVTKSCDEWNDPESGSERALFTALADFAQRYNRSELKNVPWLLWGHSGGSSWSAQMIVRHPDRVLAASFRGGCHKQFGMPAFREKFIRVAKELPLLFVWGKRESVPTSSHFVSWEPMNTMFRELRQQGGHVTRVIDPRSEHGCDDSRFMSLLFFDAVLAGQTTHSSVADIATHEVRDFTEANQHNPVLTWLPNDSFAAYWREFSTTGTLRPTQPPTSVPTLQVQRTADGKIQLSWSIVPELAGGLRAVRVYRDGQLWQELGLKPNDLIATSRDATLEALRPHSLSDNAVSGTAYTLTYVDAAGQESKPSAPTRLPSP